ncbi:16S rRNA (cytidine(1402)-2'-O)-methyltransferase [Acetobacteraceae bacterium]|nr:16S rRNA (cytidine(1402)-2'-O)-methyltransferase [Acetobacteraceae bacterium]
MVHSKSQSDLGGGLFLVATPIGNLEDITFRALNQLKNSDAILCEDTRITKRLLSRYNLHTHLIAFHDHNEKQLVASLIHQMQEGKKFSLVSDAGTPVFSDPGYVLVRAAREAGIPITALPGCNAAITALVLSGLPPAPFTFMGFTPRKQGERQHSFSTIVAAEQNGLAATIAWYESPNRLLATLDDLIHVFGADRQGAATRELTKYFEEVQTGSLAEIKQHFEEHTPRGEFVLLIAPSEQQTPPKEDLEKLIKENLEKALENHSFKDAVMLVSGTLNLPKKIIYTKALDIKNKHSE